MLVIQGKGCDNMLSKVFSSGILGIRSYKVEVEVDVANGLPVFNIVGMGDQAISESRERIRAALKNCGFNMLPKRIVVNLLPAGIKKEGPQFDLPISLGILMSMGYIDSKELLTDYMYIGEVSLAGEIRRTKGVINAVICAKEQGIKGIIVPYENYNEASMVEGVEVIPVRNLKDVINFIEKRERVPYEGVESKKVIHIERLDFKDVKGQSRAKRALEIAAAGGHNIFMVGSPGAGKSMMARRIPSILPSMSQEEIIESTKIYSSAGMLSEDVPIITERPFRAPHHTSSLISLIGGGRTPRAGEVSLAHNGVLFLDEATEYPKNILETLRQPMEDRRVSITRSSYRVEYPCSFMMVMACNPCPCGMLYEDDGRCNCSNYDIERYGKKISGPIIDRMDLYIEIKRLNKDELTSYGKGEPSKTIKNRVEIARKIQKMRYNSSRLNSIMNQKQIRKYCILDEESSLMIKGAIEKLGLSARSYDKVLKVARTIADLEESHFIMKKHLLEALSFRRKD